jgi:predicted ester cyclase
MSPDDCRALAARFFAEQDRLRGGPAAELCASGYTAHLAGGAPMDLAGHQAFSAGFYAGFPDLRHQVDLTLADGERAAVRFTLFGTHTGEFLGMPPTGRPIRVTANVCMAIDGGRVQELWGEVNMLSLMRQLTGEAPAADREAAGGI